jgi:hypothetical protein
MEKPMRIKQWLPVLEIERLNKKPTIFFDLKCSYNPSLYKISFLQTGRSIVIEGRKNVRRILDSLGCDSYQKMNNMKYLYFKEIGE